ncbi:hypothetical protein F4804DRAFT_338590 [Jackrogersella minutella]|nr:hypothetical protein F4804DRAFT_338590 [Jackrogersella minutella]
MQLFAVTMAFFTAVMAQTECSPPEYVCKADFTGWLVCTAQGYFVDGGNCTSDTWCEYINNLPYCI